MTSRVDFYILEQPKGQSAFLSVCQLIEKDFTENKKIYIQTENEKDAEYFDHLLWTYKDISFLPHAVTNEVDTTPIQICYNHIMPATLHATNDSQNRTLINLSPQLPEAYTYFNLIMEVVFKNEELQQLARERYKKYRELNCELNTYKM